MDPEEPQDPEDDLLWKSSNENDPYPWKLGNGKTEAGNLRDMVEADPNFKGVWIGGKFIPNPKYVPKPDQPERVNPLDPQNLKPYVSPFDGISKERLLALTEDVGRSIKAQEAAKSKEPSSLPTVRVKVPVGKIPKPE